jgi:hypothetical protein
LFFSFLVQWSSSARALRSPNSYSSSVRLLICSLGREQAPRQCLFRFVLFRAHWWFLLLGDLCFAWFFPFLLGDSLSARTSAHRSGLVRGFHVFAASQASVSSFRSVSSIGCRSSRAGRSARAVCFSFCSVSSSSVQASFFFAQHRFPHRSMERAARSVLLRANPKLFLTGIFVDRSSLFFLF